ncbi:hypothetical protein Tdes44962_MAKER05299 [Teratosphaeria destructans]|uniref:Uncharacterized protein n=1 Tax=Teratosphaeria destructans TaxID=418781 RepID=A0A9W7SKB1_9PEZI|nr:hypothetical protein Tdes44962_MAKER05299 [Teratosphaeria destructans]
MVRLPGISDVDVLDIATGERVYDVSEAERDLYNANVDSAIAVLTPHQPVLPDHLKVMVEESDT